MGGFVKLLQNLTGAFIGTRVEALQAFMNQISVTSILCVEGSRAHQFCMKSNVPFKVLKRNDRRKSLDLFASLGEQIILSAGFPWIIDEETLNSVAALKLNSHPSKLPSFKGNNAIKDALENGSNTLGVSVHYMKAEVDSGPIIVQEEFSIEGLSLLEIYELAFGVIEPRVINQALSIVTSQFAREVNLNLKTKLS